MDFTHLQVELRGLMVAGKVWDKGDLVPLDGSTPEAVSQSVMERVAKLEHPHLTPGNLVGGKFTPLKPKAESKAESKAEAKK